MALIPNNKLFIVTSALNTGMGVVSAEDRLQQTISGLKTLRKVVPDAIVILAEGSPNKVDEEKFKELTELVDFIADFSTDPDVGIFAKNHKKSEAECVLLLKTLLLLKQEPTLMKMMHSVDRIFKFSGRTDLLNSFNIHEHNHWGKYVFKKRIPTWLSDSRKVHATDLLITRMYSFCPSLIDDYMQVLQKNISVIMQMRIDTEHAHFLNINKDLLVELDTIHCIGTVATTGTTEIY